MRRENELAFLFPLSLRERVATPRAQARRSRERGPHTRCARTPLPSPPPQGGRENVSLFDIVDRKGRGARILVIARSASDEAIQNSALKDWIASLALAMTSVPQRPYGAAA
jgi:hypothetical protein